VALVRDPWWIFVYWELDPARVAGLSTRLGGRPAGVLRLHQGGGGFRDHEVQFESGSAYLNAWEADRHYQVELGLKDAQGRFEALAASADLYVPRDQPAPEGEAWDSFKGAETFSHSSSAGALPEPGPLVRPAFIASLALQQRNAKPQP
jgi:hypothetical protein